MPIVVDAVYQDGILKPEHPLPLKDAQKVRVIVEPSQSWAERTYGLLRWTGDLDTLRRIAEDPELGIREAR
jgi:predicted DNA-binding antitoxin AbrB/MazE fold protein